MDSLNGFQSGIWGPAAWLFLHCITLNYEPSKHNKDAFFQFFKNVQFVLPCGTCRDNYVTVIQSDCLKLTVDVFKSRESLSKWLFHVHNHINIKTNKKLRFENNLKGYKEMRQFYEQFRAKCSVGKNEIGCTKAMHKGKKMRCVLVLKPGRSKCKSLRMKKSK